MIAKLSIMLFCLVLFMSCHKSVTGMFPGGPIDDLVKAFKQIAKNNAKLLTIARKDLGSIENEFFVVSVTAAAGVAREESFLEQNLLASSLTFRQLDRTYPDKVAKIGSKLCRDERDVKINQAVKDHQESLSAIKDATWTLLEDLQRSDVAMAKNLIEIDAFNNGLVLKCLKKFIFTYASLRTCLEDQFKDVNNRVAVFYENFEITRGQLEVVTKNQADDYKAIDDDLLKNLKTIISDYEDCLKNL